MQVESTRPVIPQAKGALALYFSYHGCIASKSDMSYSDVVFGDVLLCRGHC